MHAVASRHSSIRRGGVSRADPRYSRWANGRQRRSAQAQKRGRAQAVQCGRWGINRNMAARNCGRGWMEDGRASVPRLGRGREVYDVVRAGVSPALHVGRTGQTLAMASGFTVTGWQLRARCVGMSESAPRADLNWDPMAGLCSTRALFSGIQVHTRTYKYDKGFNAGFVGHIVVHKAVKAPRPDPWGRFWRGTADRNINDEYQLDMYAQVQRTSTM